MPVQGRSQKGDMGVGYVPPSSWVNFPSTSATGNSKQKFHIDLHALHKKYSPIYLFRIFLSFLSSLCTFVSDFWGSLSLDPVGRLLSPR